MPSRASKHSRKSIGYLPHETGTSTRSTFGHALGAENAHVFGKPGWRRVSTRQWIRDFREHISKYQTYPYKPICGCLFWSFGYYPDMVSKQSYQKYITKYPLPPRRGSHGSEGGGYDGGEVAGHYDENAKPGETQGSSTPSDASTTSIDSKGRKSRKSIKIQDGAPSGGALTGSETSMFQGSSDESKKRKSKRKSKKGGVTMSEETLGTSSAASVGTEETGGSKRKSKRKSKKSMAPGVAPGESGESLETTDTKKDKRKSKKKSMAPGATPAESGQSLETTDTKKEKRKSKKGGDKTQDGTTPPATDVTTTTSASEMDQSKSSKRKSKAAKAGRKSKAPK